jgi:signal transduction histidine kinase
MEAPPVSIARGPLPSDFAVTTPGMLLVVDAEGRLIERSPRANKDPELGRLVLGDLVDPALLARADTRRRVREGSTFETLRFSRGDAPLSGGLSELDCGAMLERLRNLIGILVASLDTEDMVGAGPVSSRIGTTRRREVDRIVEVMGHLEHTFAPIEAAASVDVDLVVRRTIDQLRGSALARGLRLRHQGPPEAGRVRTGDEALLGAALVALLHNAIEASPRDAEVSMQVEASPAAITIVIDDAGPGLLPSGTRALGTPFATGKHGHVGLGLALARRAAFAHDGELNVSTRESGAGVAARLWLPVA